MTFMGVANAVTVNFDGTVVGDFAGTVAVGDSFSGSFSYVIPTPNAGGSFDDVITSASFTINGVTNAFDFTVPPTFNNITITNNNVDSLAAAIDFSPDPLNLTMFEIVSATDLSGTAIPGSGNALPTDFVFDFTDPSVVFGTLDIAFGDFFGAGVDLDITGDLSSLYTLASAVPEPSLLGLFGLGLLMVSVSRRKRAA
jgi:hypothetical protein